MYPLFGSAFPTDYMLGSKKTYTKMKFMANFSSGHSLKHLDLRDFPSHLGVKDLPAHARDTDLMPGPGGSHLLWGPEPVSHKY